MLIGLVGVPHSGKSEVSRILVEQHGFELLDVKPILRELAATITGLTPEDFITHEDKLKTYRGVTRRTIMGEVGNNLEAMFGPSYITDVALERLDRFNNPHKKVVVDCLRKEQPLTFPGLVYEVISDKSIDTGNAFDLFNRSRTSGILCNMGSLSDLEATVKRVFDL